MVVSTTAENLVSLSALFTKLHSDFHSLCKKTYILPERSYEQSLLVGSEELTKCYEPLQKLRVRLWPCKIDLNPPVTLCY